jgi:hypothetical protein
MQEFTPREYNNCRYLYFGVLPVLAMFCSKYDPDWDRILELEHDLYNQMLSYLFIKANHRALPSRVEVWRYRLRHHDRDVTGEAL